MRDMGRMANADGGAEGNRTPDLIIANDALYQLSYSPASVRRGLSEGVTRLQWLCSLRPVFRRAGGHLPCRRAKVR